jgi:hypothetical protein
MTGCTSHVLLPLLSTDAGSNHIYAVATAEAHSGSNRKMTLDMRRHHSTNGMRRRAHSSPPQHASSVTTERPRQRALPNFPQPWRSHAIRLHSDCTRKGNPRYASPPQHERNASPCTLVTTTTCVIDRIPATCIANMATTTATRLACAFALTLTGGLVGEDIDRSPVNTSTGLDRPADTPVAGWGRLSRRGIEKLPATSPPWMGRNFRS